MTLAMIRNKEVFRYAESRYAGVSSRWNQNAGLDGGSEASVGSSREEEWERRGRYINTWHTVKIYND